MAEYNRSNFINNLQYYMQGKGITTHQLEEDAQLSRGYISRLCSDASTGNPQINNVVSIANALGVSVETLVFGNQLDMTENEKLIITMLERFMDDTKNRTLIWTEDNVSSYTALAEPLVNYFINMRHPLFDHESENRYHGSDEVALQPYRSSFYSNARCNESLHTEISDGNYLFLMHSDVGLELYTVSQSLYFPVCCDKIINGYNITDTIFAEKLTNLYKEARDSGDRSWTGRMADALKDIFHDYLNSSKRGNNNEVTANSQSVFLANEAENWYAEAPTDAETKTETNADADTGTSTDADIPADASDPNDDAKEFESGGDDSSNWNF